MPNNDEELVRLVTGGAAGRTRVEVLARASEALVPEGGRGFNEAVSQLAVQLAQLRSVSQAQAETVAENTQAVIENTVAQASGKSTVASAAGGIAKRIFASGLGLAPVASAIVNLFRGEPEPPPPLPVYTRPQPLQFEGVVARLSAQRVESAALEPTSWRELPAEAPLRPAAPVTVNVQVQAMDSRSFLDHSDEIARAVRAAMLHSHSLNDVVNEL